MLGATLKRLKSKPGGGKSVVIALLLAALALLLSVNAHQARTLERQRATIRKVLDQRRKVLDQRRKVLDQREGGQILVPGTPPVIRRIAFPHT